MLHFGYICRATCELFLFARLSRESTKNYLFLYLLLGGGEWWEWGRESKTVKKKKNSLRKLKFLQWAKSVPPLVSAFLLSLLAPQPLMATLGPWRRHILSCLRGFAHVFPSAWKVLLQLQPHFLYLWSFQSTEVLPILQILIQTTFP